MNQTEWLTPAWMQRALECMRDMLLHVEPDLRRKMIQFLFDTGLWDESKISSFANAETRWNACLNPSIQTYFKTAELWALMKRFGRHHLFLAMAEDLGYEVRLKSTEERRQELLDRLASAMEANNRLALAAAEELARLDPAARQQRLHPAIAEGTASFAMDDAPDAGSGVGGLVF